MDLQPAHGPGADFLPRAAGGELAERIRAFDWARTPLGPAERWPALLKHAVGICVASTTPMCVWWGEERIVLYNDAYARIIGDRHPAQLGARAREAWADIWGVLGPLVEVVFGEGRTVGGTHMPLTMWRHGRLEESFFAFSYSPITDEDGGVAGMFCACDENTADVLRQRRLELLQALATDPSDTTLEAAAARAIGALEGHPDVPFALLYLPERGGDAAVLAARSGLERGAALAPERMALRGGTWPLGEGEAPRRVAVPGTAGERRAWISPLAPDVDGFLMLGVNPLRPFDDDYDAFFRLLARHLGTSLAVAQARAGERARLDASAGLAARAERERAQLEAVLLSVHDGVLVLDMNGEVVLANAAEARLAEVAAPEDLKREHQRVMPLMEFREMDGELVPPHDWPHERVLRGETISGIDLRLRRLDVGDERIYSFSGAPVRDAEGRQTLAVVITREITEVKRAEQALRESEARFRDMANSLPLLTWMADPDGHIFWFNQRWFDYTGTTLEDMQGWGWTKVHHPDHVDRVVRRIARSFATGRPWEDTFPLRSRTGEWRWFLSRAMPLRDEEGEIVRWFGSNTDVTDERNAREELALALQARDEFLSIASHELKTPLASLRLQAQMMKRGIAAGDASAFEPERVARLAEQAERQTRRLSRLIDDMLDISRIRTGKLTIERAPVALDEVARDVVERMQDELEASGTPVELVIEANVEGRWDRLRLEQVLANLLTNARRYGERRPVTVRVSRRGDAAHLAVLDRGLGIPPENLERVFERYERAGAGAAVAGLGLGLFVSREIVKAHGGRIWAESEGPGRGSTFHVELPLDGVAPA